MKQHITIEQLSELSEKGKERLRNWWEEIAIRGDLCFHKSGGVCTILNNQSPYFLVAYDPQKTRLDVQAMRIAQIDFDPLLSIGQMIEFLDEHLKTDWSIHHGKDLLFFASSDRDGFWGITPKNKKGELADGLWEIIKEVLEK